MSRTINTRTQYKIVGSDYSAQEPRLTAFMSQDPAMMQAYKEGKDLYCVIAAAMFGNKYEDNLEFYPEGTEIEIDGQKIITGYKTHLHKAGKERRSAAKTMLLAILYGMSPATAGARMGKSKEEGQQLMDNFFKQFPKVKELMDKSKSFLKQNGYVEDWAGRRRRLPDISIKPYDAISLSKNNDADTFNPFFGCENRVFEPEAVKIWKKIMEAFINESQKAQYKKNSGWGGNDEMSNAEFKWLASVAVNPAKMRNELKDKNNPKFGTNNNWIKRISGYDIPNEPVLLIANTGRRAQADRQCLNARIQGGAASLTKLAMVNIFNDAQLREYNAKLIISVHDEVLVECPALYADAVEKRLPQIMIETAKPYINVPMSCDPYNVTRWYCDEAAVSIREEFKKLEKTLSRDEALAKVCANHIELPQEAIKNAIEQGIDLDF